MGYVSGIHATGDMSVGGIHMSVINVSGICEWDTCDWGYVSGILIGKLMSY